MSDVKVRPGGPTSAPEYAGGAMPPSLVRPESRDGSDQGSFGRALAAAREARGMSLAEVAAQLRLNARQVEAIEAEDLEALPEGPFVRGYVRNYAKLVDLAAEPLLSLLNSRLKPTDPLHSSLAAGPVSPLQRTPREPISALLVIGGVVLLLTVLASLGWWSMHREAGSVAVPAASPSVAAPEAAAPPPRDAAPPEAQPAAAEAQPAAAEAQPAAATRSTSLRLTFRERSWVEIRQADGTILMSQNNAAGTTREVDGKPPFLVVIGNASKVTLEYGGEPVDLASSISRDDVARLRLE